MIKRNAAMKRIGSTKLGRGFTIALTAVMLVLLGSLLLFAPDQAFAGPGGSLTYELNCGSARTLNEGETLTCQLWLKDNNWTSGPGLGTFGGRVDFDKSSLQLTSMPKKGLPDVGDYWYHSAVSGGNIGIYNAQGYLGWVLYDDDSLGSPFTGNAANFYDLNFTVKVGATPGPLSLAVTSGSAGTDEASPKAMTVSFTNPSGFRIAGGSGDNSLGTLGINKTGAPGTIYSVTPSFTAGSKPLNNEYTVVVPNGTTSVTINATKYESHAEMITAMPLTVGSLPVGVTDTTILVTAQDGTTETYTIHIKRLNNVAELSNLTLTSANINIGSFSTSTLSYSASVAYAVSATTVNAPVVSGSNATVTGDGAWSLGNTGGTPNTRDVVVSAENCASQYSGVPDNSSECVTKTYTININRAAPGTDATLSALATNASGSMTSVPSFNSATDTYTLSAVANNVSSVTINATPTDSNASISGDGSRSLNVGDNALNVVVTAQDGTTTRTYTINIHRKSSDNTLSNLSLSSSPNGVLSPSFSSGTLTGYTYTVDQSVSTITVTAALSHAAASITGVTMSGSATLNGGSPMPSNGGSATYYSVANGQTLTISTISENGDTASYVITISKVPSSNADLGSLSVDQGSLSPSFAAGTTSYTVSVASNVSSITVSAAPAYPLANVTAGTGAKSLNYGSNTITVTVTAENGTATKDYTITVTRAYKTDATLGDLKTDFTTSGSMVSVPSFSSSIYTYNLGSVPYSRTSIAIAATKNDSDASVSGDGTRSLTVGSNDLEVVVTAHDGTTTLTYHVIVNRTAASSNASLSNLQTNASGSLATVPGFNSSTYVYNLSAVANSVTSINIAATPADANASVTGDTESQSLADGNNSFTVTVTAEDGSTTQNYTINIRRTSSNNRLSSLNITSSPEGTFSPTFNPTTYGGYIYSIDPEVTSITVTAALADSSASITGVSMPGADLNGSAMPTVGGSATYDNVANGQVLTISTISESGASTSYSVTINKSGLSVNANLATLSVNTGTLTPGFTASTTAYTVDVPHNVSSITVSATAAHPAASVISGTGAQSLNYGTNTITVRVQAEDPTATKDYVITVNRAKKTDASITDLKTDVATSGTMVTVPGFPRGDNTYDLGTVPYTRTSINIAVTKGDSDASVSGDGTRSLTTGSNDLTVTVTAQDGTTTIDYHIIINRTAPSSNANLSNLTVSEGTLTPAFSASVTSYTVSVANSVASLNVTATAADPAATVLGDGTKTLSVGPNTVNVTVTAENGTTNTYVIVITRDAPASSDQITSVIHTIDANYILTVADLQSSTDLKDQLDNPNSDLYIFQSNGSTPFGGGQCNGDDIDGCVGTGMIVKLIIGGIEKDHKTIVILGDVNGDGTIDATDMVLVANHFMEKITLTGAKLIAGNANKDFDDDGVTPLVDATDMVLIANHYMGKSSLH